MFEVEILRNIRETFGGEEALVFWQTVTHLGDAGLVWIALGLFLVCFPGFRRVGCTIGIALFSGFLICNVLLKPMIDRLRPCELHLENLLLACPVDPSFPSGHTTASFAAAIAFSAFHPKWGLSLLTLAVLIAWSRMFLFVHWPSDVAVGILVGTLACARTPFNSVRAIRKLRCVESLLWNVSFTAYHTSGMPIGTLCAASRLRLSVARSNH